jgi:hypothetical protein
MKEIDLSDQSFQDQLVAEIAWVIREHYYRRGVPTRIAVYEVLQALAFNAALCLHGCDKDPQAVRYFLQRFDELLMEEANGQTPN